MQRFILVFTLASLFVVAGGTTFYEPHLMTRNIGDDAASFIVQRSKKSSSFIVSSSWRKGRLFYDGNTGFDSLLSSSSIIRSSKKPKTIGMTIGIGGDPNFARRVAGKVHPSVALVTPVGVRNITSRGSAFVVDWKNDNDNGNNNDDDDGIIYLLTSAHVAAPGHQLMVSFPQQINDNDDNIDVKEEDCDSKIDDIIDADLEYYSHQASVIRRDIHSDVALIKVDINSTSTKLVLPAPLELSSKKCIDVGTLAFASGYPGGISGRYVAMTMGIVCGMATSNDLMFNIPNRQKQQWTGLLGQQEEDSSIISNDKNNEKVTSTNNNNNDLLFVVTDAAMSGGMSGGPLTDVDGTVLGINALVRSDMRSLGNYAVSAYTCRHFLDQLKQEQKQKQQGPAKATTEPTTKEKETSTTTTTYQVMLYNDPLNKRERVTQILTQVAEMNETDATKTMIDAHTTGMGVIQTFNEGIDDGESDGKTKAETEANNLCNKLREQDILVEVVEKVTAIK